MKEDFFNARENSIGESTVQTLQLLLLFLLHQKIVFEDNSHTRYECAWKILKRNEKLECRWWFYWLKYMYSTNLQYINLIFLQLYICTKLPVISRGHRIKPSPQRRKSIQIKNLNYKKLHCNTYKFYDSVIKTTFSSQLEGKGFIQHCFSQTQEAIANEVKYLANIQWPTFSAR